MTYELVKSPEILNVKVSTENPLYEIGKLARFAHNTTEETFLEDGMNILHQGVFSVPENIGIEVECEVSERLARQINRHRHMSIVQQSTRYNDLLSGKVPLKFYQPNGIPENVVKEYYDMVEKKLNEIREEMDLYKRVRCQNEQAIIEQLNYLLPLSTITKVYYHMNLSTLMHMCNVRLCRQALPEFNDFLELLKKRIKKISPEWYYVAHYYLVPHCIKNNNSKCQINHDDVCEYQMSICSDGAWLENSYNGEEKYIEIRKKLRLD